MGNVIRGRTVTVLAVLCLIAIACGDRADAPPADTPPADESVPAESTQAPDEDGAVPGDSTPDPQDETTSPDRTLPPTTLETVPPQPPPVVGEVPADLLDLIRADAAERTGVAVADLEVIRGEAVAWNDGSLGCAEPGQVYTQAIVLGFWVEIDAGGQVLDYRTNDSGFFKLCEGPVVQPPPTTAPNR